MGSPKAIAGFETGNLLGLPEDLALADHLKDICVNNVAAYELLPTSRYGSFISLDGVDQTHTQGRAFLESRLWAVNSLGSIKPMLAYSDQFHQSLMIYGNHVTDYVDSTYIVGTGHDTAVKAHYVTLPDGSVHFDYLETDDGDGTVPTRSASNGRSYYIVVTEDTFGDMAEHSGLLNNYSVLDYIRTIIGGVSIQNYEMSVNSPVDAASDPESQGDRMCLVLQGVKEFSLRDSKGNKLLIDGENIHRINADGTREEVGHVWLINLENSRYQYILDPDNYSFDDIVLDKTSSLDAIYFEYDNWLYTSKTRFNEIPSSDMLTINIAPGSCMITDMSTRAVIEATEEASVFEIQQLNKDKQ